MTSRFSTTTLRARSIAGRALGRQLARRWSISEAQISELNAKRAKRLLASAAAKRGYGHLEIGPAALADPLAFIEAAPALHKDMLRGHESDFWRERGTISAATSGTTGTPLQLRRSLTSVLEEEAWISQWRSWAGFRFGARHAELRGTLMETNGTDVPHAWNAGLNKLSLSSYHLADGTVRRYAELLREYRVEWVFAYPSAITALLVLAEHAGADFPPMRGVFTSSENLSPNNRHFVESRLGCAVWDHYGNAERTVAASQCEQLRYHLLPGYALVAPSGQTLVTTGLTNTAMPLLQYVVTDAVSGWEDGTCECERIGPTFSGVHGRSESFLVGEGGRLVGRMDQVFKGLPGAVAGQLHQSREGYVTIRVVPSGELSSVALIELVTERTSRRMGAIKIEVEIVDQLLPQRNGKVPFVIQELDVPGGVL